MSNAKASGGHMLTCVLPHHLDAGASASVVLQVDSGSCYVLRINTTAMQCIFVALQSEHRLRGVSAHRIAINDLC